MTSGTRSRLIRTDELKKEIAEALPISAVAERLCDVELQRSGAQLKGLCPIHGEGTASFHVHDGKAAFYCFGCKAGGDAIELVREVHHVGFAEALYLLAKEAGVEIERYERPLTDEEKETEALRAWCEVWLRGTLDHHDDRLSIDIQDEWGIGTIEAYAPDRAHSWFNGDRQYLIRPERGGGRTVVFPYRAASGRLVGWKVRHSDKKMFLTPHDFPLWEPVVWGLDRALPHVENGELIVVEGEYDALALVAVGVQNVVAIGGSMWTDQQMQILVDHKIKRVLFWMDGDEGGRTACESIARRFWDHPSIQVRLQQAPAGADPEDMVGALGAMVPEGRVALEWLLRQEWESEPRLTLGAKLAFVTWIRTEYGERLSGLEESLVLRAASEWLGVPEADVLDFARAEQTVLQVPDSEKVVLGRCVRDAAYYRALRRDRVTMDDFHVIKHRRLWQVLEGVMAEGLDWDLLLIQRRAGDQGVGAEYVAALAEMNDSNLGWHEDQMIDFAIRRGARQDADRFRELIADVRTPANQVIGQLTHAIATKALQRGSNAFRSIVDQVDEAMDTLHARMKNPDDCIGLSFGSQFPMLTRNLQGAQPRRLIVVAATSGRGKSTLTLQWCANWAVGMSVPVDFISLEMDTDEILYKICSHMTGIDSMKISAGRLDAGEARRVEAAMARVRKSPLRIYAPDDLTTNEFLLYARESRMERRTEAFVVDYAQMIGRDAEDRELRRDEQLGRFAYTSKLKIARGLDTCVILCAQLKRDAAAKEEPTPEDMGDSYDISRASDVVVLISQAEDSSLHDIWIGKNRQGPPQVRIPVRYDKPNQTLAEPQGAPMPDYRLLSA